MHRYLLCGIVLTVLALGSYSFGLESYLDHYTEQDGLITNIVNWVCIGSDGTKWFGHPTEDGGVTRFDGLNWESFPLDLGNRIVDMTLDRYERVWVALISIPGFAYLENGEFHLIPEVYPTIGCGWAIMFDQQGHLWGGGFGGGVIPGKAIPFVGRSRNHGITWTFWETASVPLNFDVDLQGRVWFGGRHGLYRQTLNGETWERIDDDVRLPTGISYQSVFASQTGRVWVQGYSRADYIMLPPFYSDDYENWLMFDESPLKPTADNDLRIQCVAEDGMWFTYSAPYLNGAFYYDYCDWRFITVGSPLRAIQVDQRTRDVWFGTYNGIYVMRGGPETWPPVWIELEALVNPGGARPTLSLLGSAEFQMDLQLDLYVAVQLPDGTVLYAPDWAPSMTPYASGVDVPIGLTLEGYPLLELDVTGIPSGTYRWHAACTYAGTMDFASNVASCEWQFE